MKRFFLDAHSEPPKLQLRAVPLCCSTTTEEFGSTAFGSPCQTAEGCSQLTKLHLQGQSLVQVPDQPLLHPPCFPAGLDWCKAFLTPHAKHFWFISTRSSRSQSSGPLWNTSQTFGNYSSCFRILHKPMEGTLCFSSCDSLNVEQFLALPSAHHFPLSVVQRELSCSQNPSHICEHDHSWVKVPSCTQPVGIINAEPREWQHWVTVSEHFVTIFF